MRNVSPALFLLALSAALPAQAAQVYSPVALPDDLEVVVADGYGGAVNQPNSGVFFVESTGGEVFFVQALDSGEPVSGGEWEPLSVWEGYFLFEPEVGGVPGQSAPVADLGDFAYLYGGGSINDQGQIVGVGELKNGGMVSFLATPVSEVPVPAAAWLFGSALLGLWGARRRA